MADDNLNPRVSPRSLPPRIGRNRALQAAQDEGDRERYEQGIVIHVAARRAALDHLANAHQTIADAWDLDLTGDTRPAATWQMLGRCLGIARSMLDLLLLGYAAEVVLLARSLHEANRLLDALGDPDEDPLLRMWLSGKKITPRDARMAEQRFEERLGTVMTAAGEPELHRTEVPTRKIYGQLSEAAHHQRRWVQDAVAPALRTMLHGPIPTWERRAATASLMLMIVGEAIDTTGGALERFHGAPWYAENIKPYWARFEALEVEHPLR
jgi:hypothetical protein